MNIALITLAPTLMWSAHLTASIFLYPPGNLLQAGKPTMKCLQSARPGKSKELKTYNNEYGYEHITS